jgi:hypothetical protein
MGSKEDDCKKQAENDAKKKAESEYESCARDSFFTIG